MNYHEKPDPQYHCYFCGSIMMIQEQKDYQFFLGCQKCEKFYSNLWEENEMLKEQNINMQKNYKKYQKPAHIRS